MNSIAKIFCPMKQFFSYLGASLAAIAALASCNKEIEAPVEDLKGGVPFEICASAVDTKTTIDGFDTKWVADDAINLFHAEADSKTYISDGQFTITSANLAANKFTGALAAKLEAGSYDWYALYPYSMDVTTPASTSPGYVTVGGTSQTQTGNNSTAHLCGVSCPLYGVAKAVASDIAPSIVMNHLASIIEVNVTNNSPQDLTVSSVSFTGTEDIVGNYYVNFTQTPVIYTSKDNSSVSNTVSLSVTEGAPIKNGESAKFYIAVKPFTISSGTLKVAVNGAEKEITISNKTVFAAGKIKKINFNVDYVTIPWTEDFSGNLGIYSLVNGETATKTYNEQLAGGAASPELLVAKNNGSFSAKVKASAGNYVLTFKSNHADYLSISVDDAAITLNKLSDTEYTLVIPEGVDFFNITFKNTSGSNTRLDDISLKSDERTPLTKPSVTASLNKDTPNSINVTWNAVDKAGSYEVTATPSDGNPVSNIVTANGSSSYLYTISGLDYVTEYTISVVAKPSDTTLYLDSDAGEAEQPVKTGAIPEGIKEFTSTFTDKDLATKENNGITWKASIAAKSFESASPSRGVQFGTAKGTFTITGKGNIGSIKKITMIVSTNGTSNVNTIDVKIGNSTIGSQVKLTKNNNYEISFESNIALTGDIVISVNDSNKSVYFKSIKINPAN